MAFWLLFFFFVVTFGTFIPRHLGVCLLFIDDGVLSASVETRPGKHCATGGRITYKGTWQAGLLEQRVPPCDLLTGLNPPRIQWLTWLCAAKVKFNCILWCS